MRSLSFAITFAILALWITPVAQAETFTDPEAAFRVEVPVGPAEIACVAFPSWRMDEAACEGQNLESFVGVERKVGAMTLTRDGSTRVVLINREMEGTARPDQYALVQDTMVNTFRGDVAAGSTVREASRRVSRHGGADVVEVVIDLERAGGGVSTTFVGFVPIDGGAYGIIVSGPKAERASLRELFDSILDSMQVTPPNSVDAEDPRMKDPAYRLGYRIGESFSWIFTVVWWAVSLALILVIGIRGHRTWRALPDGPATSSATPSAPSVRGPVVNPFKRDAAKTGALPSTFFGGYDDQTDKKRDA